jgi:hypothetical protein
VNLRRTAVRAQHVAGRPSIITGGSAIGWVPRSGGTNPRYGVIVREVVDVIFALEMVWPKSAQSSLIRGLARIVTQETAKVSLPQ